jgi:hypothetical protein
MTTPGMQGEVSPDRWGKWHLQPSKARSTRNRPLPQLLGNTAEQSRLKPCTGKPFELSNELELESQKGNSGSNSSWVLQAATTNLWWRHSIASARAGSFLASGWAGSRKSSAHLASAGSGAPIALASISRRCADCGAIL